MPRNTDDNKYGQCNGVAETAASGACPGSVTTDVDEEQDRTETQGEGRGRFRCQVGTRLAAAALQAKQ